MRLIAIADWGLFSDLFCDFAVVYLMSVRDTTTIDVSQRLSLSCGDSSDVFF